MNGGTSSSTKGGTSGTGVKSGKFYDDRPWFVVAVTGHPAVIGPGLWMYSQVERLSFAQPGAAEVRSYLDAVLWRRRSSHRVLVRCRMADTGIDNVVRAYCEIRNIVCSPTPDQCDTWGTGATFRRDLYMLAESHALVWFGPREAGGLESADGPDPVTLAAWLNIPYRVVPLGTTSECLN